MGPLSRRAPVHVAALAAAAVMTLSGPASALVVAGELDPLVHVLDVELAGDRAVLVGSPNDALIVLDVSEPARPQPLGSAPSGGGTDVELVGDIAYVSRPFEGVRVYDLSDSTEPTLIEVFDPSSGASRTFDLEPDATRLYVAGEDGLHVLDSSDPGELRAIATVPVGTTTGSWPRDVEVRDGLLYLSTTIVNGVSGDLIVLDLSDPLKPEVVGFWRECCTAGEFVDLIPSTADAPIWAPSTVAFT